MVVVPVRLVSLWNSTSGLRERLRSSFFERLLAIVYTHVENFFARIEAMQVPSHADERLLHQILRPVGVARLSGDEMDEPIPVAVEQLLKGTGPAAQMSRDQLLVGHCLEIARLVRER